MDYHFLGLHLVLIFIRLTVHGESQYYIKPSEDDTCFYHPCLTLSQLASKNISRSEFNRSLSLFFMPGNHTLDKELSPTNENNLSIMNYPQDADKPVIVKCLGMNGKLIISQIITVSIKSLHFADCRCSIKQVKYLVLEDISFQDTESIGTTLMLTNVAAAFIVQSSFINCGYIQQSNSGRFRNDQDILEYAYLERNAALITGGAVCISFSNVSILSSNFIDNRADIGGAFFAYKSNVTITGSNLNHNRATLGGVIVTSRSNIIVDRCIFSKNAGEKFGGVLISYKDSFMISSSEFVNNIAGIDGGVMNSFNTLISVNQSSFFGNTANRSSGVIYAANCVYYCINTAFSNNTVKFQGGVMTSNGNSLFHITSNTFVNNRADDDGGVLVASDKAIFNIANNVFISNSASKDCGVIIAVDESLFITTNSVFASNNAKYGGVLCIYHTASFMIIGSTFTSNIGTFGSVMYTYDNSEISISNHSAFMNNRADFCGVICTDERSKLSIHESTFSDNSVSKDGGVIISYSVRMLLITSCVFTNNNANDNGGVIYAFYNSLLNIVDSNFVNNFALDGGVIYATDTSSFEITNCSFFSNSAVYEGGVFYAIRQPSITIINSIFTGNSANSGGVFDTTRNSSFVLINSTFTNNHAIDGGVLHTFKNSLFNIIKCVFSNNFANDTGGVIYAISNSSLSITESIFTDNLANNDGAVVDAGGTAFLNITNTIFTDNVAADNGGVLYMIQNSTFFIINSIFTNNNANRYGGVIIMFADAPLIISNSTFISNNAMEIGGVIYCFGNTFRIIIHNNTFRSNLAANFGATIYSLSCIVFVTNSNFLQNFGSLYIFNSNVTFTGNNKFVNNLDSEPLDLTSKQNAFTRQGGAITSFQSSVLFTGVSVFINNQAQSGGAVLAAESTILMIGKTIVSKNLAANGNGGGISLQRSSLEVRGHCTISNNHAVRGGGIHATSSTVTVRQPGQLQLINNTANYGGGVYLEINTKLYIQKTSRSKTVDEMLLSFIGNFANYGGAVYVSDDTNSGACLPNTECFFQTLALHQSQLTKYTTNVNFSNNTASVEASNIYGGLLDRCIPSPFAEIYLVKQTMQHSGVRYVRDISNVVLDSIGSPPVGVCFCTNNEPNCSYQLPTIRVKKGETFTISLVAVDQVNKTIEANVNSFLSSPEGGLGEGQQTQIAMRNCTNVKFSVFSPHDFENISVSADGPCRSSTLSTRQVSVVFLDCVCPIGFVPLSISQSFTRCDCICDPQLSLYISGCNSSTGSLFKTNTNSWITYINDSNSSGYVIHSNCPFNYCQHITENISFNLNLPNGEDGQCASNRGGLLCGACKVNHSLSLGSNYCLPCPSYWPAILVTILLSSIIAGIMLVAVLLALNITVTIGLINPFIFYANVISVSSGVFFPSSKFYFPAMFVSWLNLEVGVDVCFYGGLDAYTKTWIQLAFPVYIISLVILIIKISEHSPKFTRVISKRDPVATLATLILLSYAKLLSTTITALSSTSLLYPNGSEEHVWLPDANVKFFQGKHTPLALVALLIILIGLPYTILLFLWQWIISASEWKVLKWTRNTKLSSFINVYQVPYNHKYRFWTGLELIMRVVLYITASLTLSSNPQTVLLTIIILVGGLILLKGIVSARVHKIFFVDIVESVIYFNLLGLAAFSMHYYKTDITKQSAVIYASTIFTLLLLIGVMVYHTYLLRIRCSRIQPTPKALQEYPLSQSTTIQAEITCSVIELPEAEEEVAETSHL